MARFKNKKRESFLDSIPKQSLEGSNNNLTKRCKFNFSYFDVQSAGQNFGDWSHEELIDLFDKLKEYSKEDLLYWKNQKQKNYNTLEVYGDFPINSDFTFPKHIPHEVLWARFRIKAKVRVIGFVIPEDLYDREHEYTKERFDKNCFYVVFLDKEHRFYKTYKNS